MKIVFQKLIVILLALFLLPIGSFKINANETAVEFIKNGGFETATEANGPSNWSYGKGSYSVDYSIDKSNPLSGVNAMRLYATTTDLYVYQGVAGLVGGSSYTLTVNARPVAFSGNAVRIKIEYLTINSTGNSEYLSETTEILTFTKNGQWQQRSLNITVPTKAYSATIMFRLQTTVGEVYFDDLSFVGAKVDEFVPDIDPGTLPTYNEKPMLQGETEGVTNGGFEQKTASNTPLSWSPSHGWGTYLTYSDSVFMGGSGHSVRISTTDSNKPFVSTTVKNIVPFSEYQVSVWLRTHTLSGDGFGFKYEYLNDQGKSAGEELSGRFKYITGEHWTKFVMFFEPPANCASVRILFRMFGNGTLYIDNASCYKTEAPYYIKLKTDEVFYYSDMAAGKGTAKANLYSYPNLLNETVDFKLTYEGAVIKSQSGVPFNSEGVAEYNFNISDLETEKAEYKIEASIKDLGGNESAAIYRYNRPTTLNKDGVYLKDGKPFNPIFAYHVSTQYYPLMAEAGINVVQGSASKSVLDEAYKNGLMVLVVLYGNMNAAGHPINEAKTIESVTNLMSHPAVFAWAIMDEPFSNDPGAEPHLKRSYQIIRNIDPVHPVFVMEVGDKLDVAIKYADLFGIDPYIGAGVPTEEVATKTKLAYSVSSGKPIYNLLQAFSYVNYFPTNDEMRNMIYQALWENSKAVGYYCFDTSLGSIPLNYTELWPVLKSWYANESKIMFDSFVHNKNSLIEKYEDENVRFRTFKYGKDIYAAVLNKNSANTSAANITIPKDLAITDVEIIGGANSESIVGYTGNKLNVAIQKAGAALFKLSTISNIVANYSFEDSSSDIKSWTKVGFTDSSPFLMTDGDCPSGNNYLKFTNTEGTYVSQLNYNFEPNTTYKLSFWYKSSTSNKALIKIEYGDLAYDGLSPKFKLASAQSWTKANIAFTTPANIDTSKGVRIMLRFAGSLSSAQFVCYDNIVIEKADTFIGFAVNQTLYEVDTEVDFNNFYNIGKSIVSYPSNGSVSVRFFSVNNENAAVIIGLYRMGVNGEEKLEGIVFKQITSSDYGTGNAGDSLSNLHVARINAAVPTIDNLETGSYTLKVLAWNNASNMLPISMHEQIEFIK